MSDNYGAMNWVAKLARIALVIVLAALAMVLGVTLAQTVMAGEIAEVLRGVQVIALALAAMPLAVVLYGLLLARLSSERSLGAIHNRLTRLESLEQAADDQLRRIAELAPLSDQAKAMIYRERELDALREIIHENLARQNYTQVEKLLDRMENQYGYHAEVEAFRAEVAASREASTEEKVAAAVTRVERIISQNNWGRAYREAEKLAQLYPEHERVRNLPQRVTDARNAHKSKLLADYGDAVKRNDVDGSIELLKELDTYLTPQEAGALEDSARGVFRAKLHNLGVQFAIAVTDERWPKAVSVGEQIIEQFPNTRMASEVREKLDALKQRAGSAAQL